MRRRNANRRPGMRSPGRSVAALAILLAFSPRLRASAEFVPCQNHQSPGQQIALGAKAKAQVYKTTPVLPDSSPVTLYIAALGNKLVAQAPGYKWPYNFHVAGVSEINAFALPAGSVFVNLGTIQAAETEAQLAGVMAHEISHVVLQHAVCNAEKQQRVGLLAGIGQLAAGVLLGGAAGDLAQEGIGMTTGLSFLRMSREAERQADLEGVGIAYDAGFDPHGLPQFFQIIASKYGPGSAQFLSDHPNPGNRTEYVDREIASYPPRADWIVTSPSFSRLKEEVAGMHAYTAKEVSSGVWMRQSPNESVGGGVNQAGGPQVGSVAPDLNTAGAWRSFHGDGYSIDIPGNWKVYGSATSAMIGPSGGIARSTEGAAGSVVYGVLTDVYRPPADARGASAVDALIAEITSDNPGFQPGRQDKAAASRADAIGVECENPSANSGKGEHDWVVAFQQPGGALRYFVLVAPSPDFEQLRPAFERIVRSVKIPG
ncbi:MAG TPA: M48 family metalloprotease [Candidatus Sulfopaludibacter sp.]|nr:M48 family metalloprotease [Candidatus Sulfopaludibacter sp.]